jgi:hypothetical protein
VDRKAEHDISVANGTAETVDSIAQRPLHINTKRFLNVIFGAIMKPKLSTCGQTLTAMELEDKKKTDEDLFTAVIVSTIVEILYILVMHFQTEDDGQGHCPF